MISLFRKKREGAIKKDPLGRYGPVVKPKTRKQKIISRLLWFFAGIGLYIIGLLLLIALYYILK